MAASCPQTPKDCFDIFDEKTFGAILVVEDNELHINAIAASLRRLFPQYQKYYVRDGENAEKALGGLEFKAVSPIIFSSSGPLKKETSESHKSTDSIKFVVMDIGIPDPTGDKVTKKYREGNGKIIIAAYTSDEYSPEQKEKMKKEYGFNAVFHKPHEFRKLLDFMKSTLASELTI